MFDNVPVRDIVSICFLAAGMFFCLTSILGMFKLKDFYSRCHTSGNSETLALLFVCVGFMIQTGFTMLSLKILLLFIIICICNPIGTHVLCRRAYYSKYQMRKNSRILQHKEEGK